MSKWESVNLSNFVPQALTVSLSAVSSVVDQFLKQYNVALDFAKKYEQALSGSGASDLLGTLVQAVVDTFEGMLQAGKIHALFVPMRKQVPAQPANVPLTLEAMSVNLGLSWYEAASILNSGANTDYQAMLSKRGGNQGFYRTFVESLNDMFDPNRPQYMSNQDYIACTVLMVGAPSFVELVDVASAFNHVFRPDGGANVTARISPMPNDLRLTVIALPKATKIGVRLDWSVPKPIYDTPYFPRIGMRVSQYAVIRSTSPKATSAKHVLDFFATQTLTVNLTSTDAAKSSKVIAIGTGTTSSYVDDDDSLNADTTYYYCVAWRIIVSENGIDKTLPWDLVSSVAKTRVRAAAKTASSQPPDWQAYGSMLDLVPDIAVSTRTALEQLKRISDRNGGVGASLSTGIKALTDNAGEFSARLDELNARMKRLSAIFAKGLPGLYHTSFAGQGGNLYLVSELARRLNDKSDNGRPPYDGNEYVIGVVLVAGGPRRPDVQPMIDFMQLLFASSDKSNALTDIINSIDTLVTNQEQKPFGPSMKPTSPAPATTEIPAATTFNNSGAPITATDPLNPEAGNTGRPDPNADPC